MTSPIVVSSANNSTEFEPVLVNLNPRKSPCKHGYIPLEFRPTVDAAAKVEADGTSFSLDDGKIMCLDYGKTVHKSVSVSSGSVLMDVNGLSKELARGDILSTDAVKLPCGRISVDFYRVSPLPHWFITSLGSVIAVDAGLRTSLDLYPNQQYQFKFSDLGNVTYTKESKVILTYWTVKGFEGRLEDFEFETTSTCELVSRYRYILTMRVLLAIAYFFPCSSRFSCSVWEVYGDSGRDFAHFSSSKEFIFQSTSVQYYCAQCTVVTVPYSVGIEEENCKTPFQWNIFLEEHSL
eukprot:TRINITY_DN20522_c0_g1_i1.p1 TRINITY_DN20522_c0_g1~~TRINITY_DN20522_c0_g1_i1.p1  ORF type:complete len:343 (-),score=66.45 TRINITY_DN20522_c0_g1_i1:200-1078(-)